MVATVIVIGVKGAAQVFDSRHTIVLMGIVE
jgi:hypothetical protein